LSKQSNVIRLKSNIPPRIFGLATPRPMMPKNYLDEELFYSRTTVWTIDTRT